tara:strand:+ start:16760 stop:20710 length:3951 start_codon:yes stop_codon:yes gene_type:complete
MTTTPPISTEGVRGNDSYEQRLMPIVYIDKITLENNSVPPNLGDNPHIEEYTFDSSGNPVPIIRSEAQASPDGCVITLDLLVRDDIQNTILSSWFYDAQLLQYMQIKVIQSTNSQLTTKLINGQFEELENPAYKTGYTTKILGLENYYEEGTQDFYAASQANGGLMANIPYEVKLQLPTSQPDHLSYFVFCYFDIAALSRDYNLSMYGYKLNTGIMSKDITSEIVIRNGTVVSESYVFYTPEGEIWTGAVHEHNGVWMAGATHTSEPHPILTREVVINSTVQDFRDIDAPLKEEINLAPVEALIDNIKNNLNKKPSNSVVHQYDTRGVLVSATKLPIEDNPAYFSEGFIARSAHSKEGSLSNFVFSFNFEEFVKQESEFGKLFAFSSNETAKAKMLELSKILSLKVYRKRATSELSFNRINSPVRGGRFKKLPYVNAQDPPVLVVESKDDGKTLRATKENVGGFAASGTGARTTPPSKSNGSIRQIQLNNMEGIRSYAVTDATIGEVTDGLYQYSVEVSVLDGTVPYLNNMLELFSNVKHKFSLYYDICTSPTYYDSDTNQFKAALVKEYSGSKSDPWSNMVAQIVYVLGVLSDSKDASPIFTSLFSLCNGVTGTPKGVNAVLVLADKLESILVSYIGDKRTTSVDLTAKSGTGSQASKKFILQDTQTFTQLFNSELPDDYGLEFMNMKNRNSFSGPPTFTLRDYKSRIAQENDKYFKAKGEVVLSSPSAPSVPHASLKDLQTYGATYLTPVLAKNGRFTLEMASVAGDLLSNLDKYERFSIPLLNAQMQRRGDFVPSTTTTSGINNERINFLGKIGVTVANLYETNTDAAGDRGAVSAKDVLGDDSLFASPLSIVYSSEQGLATDIDLKQLSSVFSSNLSLAAERGGSLSATTKWESPIEQVEIGCFNLETDSCGILDYYIISAGGALDTAAMTRVPNQIKSLFLSHEGDTVRAQWFDESYDVANDFKTSLMFIWNYQNIAEVEYLNTYRMTSAEGRQVSAPVWEPLTFKAIQDVERSSGMVMCRLTKYTDALYKIGSSSVAQMPYYNSYFFLASTNKVAKKGNLPESSVAIVDSSYVEMRNMGNEMTKQLARAASSANMRTVLHQQPARNPHHGYYDAFKGGGTPPNILSDLYDETTGLCEITYDQLGAGPAEETPEGDREAISYDGGSPGGGGGGGAGGSGGGAPPAHVTFEETSPKQDDTFHYSSDPDIGAAMGQPENDEPDLTMQTDYDKAMSKAIQEEIRWQQNVQVQGGNDTGQSAKERNDAIAQWVQAMYKGVGEDGSQQAATQGANTGAPSQQMQQGNDGNAGNGYK